VSPKHEEHEFPYIRFANIFITPMKGNSRLRVAPPAQANFSGLPPLPNEDNPYQLTRAANESGSLELFDAGWIAAGSFEHRYAIDVDRDTNGAGLVYFANYVVFMDTAERLAIESLSLAEPEAARTKQRSLRHRRIAYYGNVDVSDTLAVDVTVFRNDAQPNAIAFRYSIARHEDGERICLSEAIKSLPERS